MRPGRPLASLAAAALFALGRAGPARAQDEAPRSPSPPAAEAPAGPRQAPGRYYLGAEGLWGTISSGHPSIDGSSGGGFQLVFGLRLSENLALDLRAGGLWTDVGPAPEITYPADRGEYALLLLGLVWELQGGGAPVSPWLGAWLGYHSVQWETYWYSVSGWGLSLGAGLQFRLPLGFMRLGAVLSLVDAASSYDAPANGTTVVILSGGWTFDWGRP